MYVVVVVVVVELSKAPEDDPQKRQSWAWKAVGLVTVGVCVWQSWLWWVGWGQGWSWCLVSMRDKARWLVVCRRFRSISRVCGEYTDCTRSYHHPGAQFWVGSSRNWSVFLERPNTGRHEKAPVRCPCSRLAALHGAPRTHVCYQMPSVTLTRKKHCLLLQDPKNVVKLWMVHGSLPTLENYKRTGYIISRKHNLR